MKATKLLCGAFALLALSACSDDNDRGKAPDYSESAYIRVNIISSASSGSRADDDEDAEWTANSSEFEYGSSEESAIENATLVFYDARGNLMTFVPLDNSQIMDKSTSTNNIDAVKTVEAKVNLPDGKFPSYMMVFANPVNYNGITSSSLGGIVESLRDSYRGANGKFAMNNSVYYSKDGELQREVKVSQADFYLAGEEPDASYKPVEVYLERLAAKVSLKMATTAGTQTGEIGTEGSTKRKLTFHVTGWGVNALAKNCYLSKRFTGKNFDVMNTQFDSFHWNDYLKYRSYWAISPFYDKTDTNKFPNVSDDISYQDASGNWQSNAKDYTLSYRSYNDLTRNIGENDAYVMENTIHSSYYNGTINDVNTSAALISVIVKGYYTLDDSNAQETFFLYGGDIYSQANYLRYMANLGAVVGRQNPDGSWAALDDTDDLADIFTIAHPTKPSVGDGGVEENKVTIQFNKNYAGTKKYYYRDGEGTVTEINNTVIAKVNADLQANCGLATAYNNGMAYFNVPIRHLAPDPEADLAWAAGAFGVVRNHHYVITIDGYADLSTATIGHGVWNPGQPIVPPSDPNDEYGIKANFNVLSWRLVNHGVTLGE